MKKAMADFDYTDAIRKKLREMSTAELGELAAETLTSTKSMTALGRGLRPTWQFGTVVQAEASALDQLAMVIKDEGAEFFAGMILGTTAIVPAGTIIQKLNRRNWAPAED